MSETQQLVYVIACDGAACVQWERGSNRELLLAWIQRLRWTIDGDKHYCPAHEPLPDVHP